VTVIWFCGDMDGIRTTSFKYFLTSFLAESLVFL
jgi:hypothetical protein